MTNLPENDDISISSKEIEELRRQLEEFRKKVVGRDINYFVYHYDRNKNPIAYLASITQEIGEKFAESIRTSISDFLTSEIVRYQDNDGTFENGVEIIRTNEVPNARRILEEIENTNRRSLDRTTADNTSGLKFAVRCGDFVAFGTLRKTNLIEKSKLGKLITMNESGTFEKLREVVIYEIPDKFASFSFKDYMIISNETIFESIFNYHEKIIELVKSHSANNQRLFSNENSFIEILKKDSRKARKIYFSYMGNYMDSIQPNDIIAYANDYNLDIKPDTNGKIDIENSNIWHVVNAINEDYYTGRLSRSSFASRNKIRIF